MTAVRTGAAGAPVRVLAVGPVHGDEPAGLAVIRALRALRPPARVQVWTLRTANPDGLARGTRVNAHGVDLNRNFPDRWKPAGRRGERYWPGPAAASEPETRALMDLERRVGPDVTVWLHQPYGMVNLRGNDRALIRRYARRVALPVGRLPAYRGTAAGWQNARRAGTTAFVVELPAGRLGDADARRHARAILRSGGPPSPR